MKIIQDLMTILEAEDHCYITDGQGNYGRKIYLGIYDSPSNWHEITEEEVPVDELPGESGIFTVESV